jgi:spermidine synthase
MLALVYEVLWHRQFSLLLGSAAPATAVVLVAYFGGLGAGSLIFGNVGRRFKRPLIGYGVLEVCIGVGSLAVTPVLSFFTAVYPELIARIGENGERLLMMKAAIAVVAIALPTIAMGGTLPVLAEFVDGRKEQLGLRVGWLYVVNSGGAALGAMLFPLVLLPRLGMERTAVLCAGTNFVIGGIAFWLAREYPRSTLPSKRPIRAQAIARVLPRPLVLAFLAGAGSFALQVVWNRAFAQIHENSISTFALITTVFILAIAVGAEFARWCLSRGKGIRNLFAGAWIACGITVLVSPSAFIILSDGLQYVSGSPGWFGWSGSLLLLAGVVIFIPIALLATGMPLLLEDAGRSSARSASAVSGLLLAASIGGSIIGAWLAGFVFPSWLGMWRTAWAVGIMVLVVGICVICRRGASRAMLVTCVVVVAGGYLPGRDLPRTHVDRTQGERLLGITEGAHGVVAVTELEGARRLKLNNHYVLGGTSAIGDERMQAHIPLLLHGRPGTVALLGYGTGITAGGALFHPGLEVTALELVPEVGMFADKYFGEANLGFASSPAARLIYDDARNYLRGAGREFDVIVGDLVVPWRPGEAGLYTAEHFSAVHRALNVGGTACVWVPLFQLREGEFEILLATFLNQFHEAFLWKGDFSPTRPAIALVAGKEPGRGLDPGVVEVRLAQLARDPFNPQLRYPAAFYMHLMGVVDNEHMASSSPLLNTEDRPWLELRPVRGGTRAGLTGPLVGRELQRWEESVRNQSRARLVDILPEYALAGWEAGTLLEEFTLLLHEGRRTDARVVQGRIRALLGPEAFESVFGESF